MRLPRPDKLDISHPPALEMSFCPEAEAVRSADASAQVGRHFGLDRGDSCQRGAPSGHPLRGLAVTLRGRDVANLAIERA